MQSTYIPGMNQISGRLKNSADSIGYPTNWLEGLSHPGEYE